MDKKPSPKPPLPRQQSQVGISQIANYRDGQVIDIPSNDVRTYCVKSGAVQRVVTLPGCQGLGPLKLGTIRGKFEGVYWQPVSAFEFARRNGIHIEFMAVGQTVIQKMTNNDLYKDGHRLITALASALIVQNELVADTELIIKREFERAEREAGEARSLRAQLEAANEELESRREKAVEDEAEFARLNRLLRQSTNDMNSALNREKVLLQEKRNLKQQLALEKTKGLGVMQRLIHEMEDLRVQFTDLTHWVESHQSDSPEVQAGQKAVDPQGMDDELDAVFDAFPPLERERSGTPSIPPLDVSEDELIPISPQAGMTFQEDEAYSKGSRNTIPFMPSESSTGSGIRVPPGNVVIPVQRTQAWDRNELQRKADEAERQGSSSEADQDDGDARPWCDSLNGDDVWGKPDPPTHIQKRTDSTGPSHKS